MKTLGFITHMISTMTKATEIALSIPFFILENSRQEDGSPDGKRSYYYVHVSDEH